jgi:hypothetical protein
MKLNPNIIPHKDFHKGIWLRSNKSPWYFFYKIKRDYKIPGNDKFYDTVDENLYDIIKLLHSKNIPTTPSCSGHIVSPKYYSNLFDTIKLVKNDIEDGGVKLLDPESGDKYFYKNRNYRLPWDKDEFIDSMDKYQKIGVLGFVDKNNLHNSLSNRINVTNDDGITLIHTKSNSENEIKNNWNNVLKLIKQKLH